MKNKFEYPESAGKWEIWEATLKNTSAQTGNPFLDTAVKGIFKSPSGKTIETKGFYDGDSTWRVRFCPGEEGKYDVVLHFRDLLGTVIEEACEFTAKTSCNRGRLQVMRDRPHFLQTGDGTPFYVFGSGMEAPVPSNKDLVGEIDYYYPEGMDPFDMWRDYLDELAGAGFNRLRFFVAWNSFPPAEDIYKDKPCGFFKYRDKYEKDPQTLKYDMTRFNTTYFQLVDRILSYAMEKGIYAEVTIFDRCCLENWEGTYRWQYNTFNEKNGGPLPIMEDVAKCWGGVSLEHLRPDQKFNGKRAFFQIAEPRGEREDWLFQMWNFFYQKLYVDYLLARTSAFSNIYYEIINEIERPMEKWSEYWFGYLRDNDPYHHLITISPIFNKKEERSRNNFLPYHLHGENNIISLHNDMHPEDPAEINPIYWKLDKPVIYDEVFWIREKKAASEPEHEQSYDDERKWFWSNFVNGSMTMRVCWQEFRKTPAFDWLRHLKSFIGEFKWWMMEPFSDGFSIAADGIDASDVCCNQCRIENNHILYLYAKDGKTIDNLRITKNDVVKGTLSIRHFDAATGKWGAKVQTWDKTEEMDVHLPHGMEDAVLVISQKGVGRSERL